MTETDGDHSEELRTEEIARSHPSAEPEQAQEPEQVADRDNPDTASRESDAGEDYAGSGF